MKKTLGKRIAAFAMALAVAATVFAGATITGFAYTQTTGTVISDNVKVRSAASTTASQVSSLKNGDVVDIVDEATDSSGYVWYKIYVNKSEFGYVRSDLVNKKGGASNTTATATSTTNAASLPETAATATEQRNATALSDSVNVRKGAGTAYDSVGKISKGDTVLITGEANGTDGKTWYQVSFGDGKTGFVRSDLVAVSDTPVETGENPEGGESSEGEYTEGEGSEGGEEQSSNAADTTGDGAYSLFYTTDEEGNGVWYLYDNFGGYRVKVKELIEAAQSADAVNSLRKTSSTYKKIAIALAILAIVLIAGIVILALKLRDSIYYEDEEEEEYDHYAARRQNREELPRSARNSDNARDEKPERPFRRNADAEDDRQPRRAAEDRVVRPVRRSAEDEYEKRPLRRQAAEEERPSRRDAEDSRPLRRQDRAEKPADEGFEERSSRSPLREAQERQARRQSRADEERAAAPKRKARNFVGDDDDFEFEFLDLDDDK